MMLPTTVVGSYPQPDWLVDRELLAQGVARTRLAQLWRVEQPWLQQAQDDATVMAVREMERAGIDIVTDGEVRRESYSNRFALSLEGIDGENTAQVVSPSGRRTEVPKVVGEIRRTHSVEERDVRFTRGITDRTLKVTLPGPFTIGQQLLDDFYGDDEELAMALATAVNEEARALVAAGVDVIQIDEPWLRNNPAAAHRYAVRVIDRALEGLGVPTVVHLCFGYAAIVGGDKPTGYSFLTPLADSCADQISIEAAQPGLDLGVLVDLAPKTVVLGVLDLATPEVETADVVADRIRAALTHISPDRLVLAPDCGMKYLPRDVAYGKLCALVEGTKTVRATVGGEV
jgi:5-methyltetrahydropteroyltriglutamate--homocysteine methyltransferase